MIEVQAPGEFRLTPREVEVVCLLANGMTIKQIAFTMGIGYDTVRGKMGDVRDKVGAETVMQLMFIAGSWERSEGKSDEV